MIDYNIQAASMLSGVSVHQIRAWEKRYGALTPARLGNNHRSYSQENITRLKLLSTLTKHGLSISKIAKHDIVELQAQVDMLVPVVNLKSTNKMSRDNVEKLGFLVSFLEAKKIDILEHEIKKFQAQRNIVEFLVPLMKRAMVQVNFKNDERHSLLETIIEQINKITLQTCDGT